MNSCIISGEETAGSVHDAWLGSLTLMSTNEALRGTRDNLLEEHESSPQISCAIISLIN